MPMECVSILGGEHNVLVGKLRGDYQADVVRRTAMEPSKRRDNIQRILEDVNVGPRQALQDKGMDVEIAMLKVPGRVLSKPDLVQKGDRNCTIGNYANSVVARNPPVFKVQWALWSFTGDNPQDLQWFAKDQK